MEKGGFYYEVSDEQLQAFAKLTGRCVMISIAIFKNLPG